jgi:hypothetical protein
MTYPVLPSTAPWLEALAKSSPLGKADEISTSANGTVPEFVRVKVKLTGSPTSPWLGATEPSTEISGIAQSGLISSGACCAVNADMTKL